MNLFTQLENNEQRSRFGSACKVQRIMPGSQYMANGGNVVGAIPVGAVIESYHIIATGWDGDVTVTVGTSGSPTHFFNGTLVDGVAQGNAQDAPVEMYFPVGAEVVMEVTAGGSGDEGVIEFVIDYSELETTAGKYTA